MPVIPAQGAEAGGSQVQAQTGQLSDLAGPSPQIKTNKGLACGAVQRLQVRSSVLTNKTKGIALIYLDINLIFILKFR